MRYVDIAKLEIPEQWHERAKVAADAVAAGADPGDYGQIWRDLKDTLGSYFYDKCWYCEMKIPRSDNAVDHFRPKGRVSDAANHPGYRWLAFELRNFRYSCTFCNSRRKDVEGGTAGGKSDRFPLLDETRRLYAPGPLSQEKPVLLDPCNVADACLIGCKWESGKPCAATQEPVKVARVKASVEILHLDHDPTCKLRHGIALQLKEDVEEGKRQFDLLAKGEGDEEAFNKVMERIQRTIGHDAQFSGDMRFVLKGFRSAEHPWIQDLIET